MIKPLEKDNHNVARQEQEKLCFARNVSHTGYSLWLIQQCELEEKKQKKKKSEKTNKIKKPDV